MGVIQYEPWVIPQALDFLVRTKDKYPFDKVVSHKYKLEEINDAFQQAEWHAREGAPTKITRAMIEL